MQLRCRYMEMTQRSGEMDFSVYGREEDELVEGVINFKYLGRPLKQYDNNFLGGSTEH